MPTYEYECKQCGVFEVEQRITEDALKVCPTCAEKGKKEPVSRLISAPAFHLKGGGWYKDLYSSSKKESSSSASASADSSSAASSASTDAKDSAPKKESKALKTTGGCGSGSCGCA